MLQSDIYYFAYGSNLLKSRLEDRVGIVDYHERYDLPNYKLDFNIGYQVSYANIVPAKNSVVEGVLYLLTQRQINWLDKYETLYNKKYFSVNGKVCFTYVGDEFFANKNCPIDKAYMDIIKQGMKEHNIFNSLVRLDDYLNQIVVIKKRKKGKLIFG